MPEVGVAEPEIFSKPSVAFLRWGGRGGGVRGEGHGEGGEGKGGEGGEGGRGRGRGGKLSILERSLLIHMLYLP